MASELQSSQPSWADRQRRSSLESDRRGAFRQAEIWLHKQSTAWHCGKSRAIPRVLHIWLWVKTVLGSHFGVAAPPILEPILVGIGMTGATIWTLTHGHLNVRQQWGPFLVSPLGGTSRRHIPRRPIRSRSQDLENQRSQSRWPRERRIKSQDPRGCGLWNVFVFLVEEHGLFIYIYNIHIITSHHSFTCLS